MAILLIALSAVSMSIWLAPHSKLSVTLSDGTRITFEATLRGDVPYFPNVGFKESLARMCYKLSLYHFYFLDDALRDHLPQPMNDGAMIGEDLGHEVNLWFHVEHFTQLTNNGGAPEWREMSIFQTCPAKPMRHGSLLVATSSQIP